MIDRRSFLRLVATGASSVALVACGGSPQDQAAQPDEGSAHTDNSFVECASAYDAAQLAGFPVTFPEAVPGYSTRLYQAIEGELVQCFYSEGDVSVLIRKGLDDGSGDISGNDTAYDQVATATVDGAEVTEKGTNDLVFVAIWTKDEYAYAIVADEGLEAAVVEELVAATL